MAWSSFWKNGRDFVPLGSGILFCLLSCQESSPQPSRAEKPTKSTPAAGAAPTNSESEAKRDPCLDRLDALSAQPPMPGVPLFEKNRAEILARARSVPLLFLRPPRGVEEESARVRRYRTELSVSRDPAHAIFEILKRTSGRREERRQIFLSEQYLFAETPLLALRLSQILRLDHLYSDDEIIIQRGARTLVATLDDGRYWLASEKIGSLKKRPPHGPLASLLLFDRIRVKSESFGPSIHVDLAPLRRSLGFSSAEVERLTVDGLILKLSTYGFLSRALISVTNGVAELECESLGETPRDHLAGARQLWLSDQDLVDPVLAAAHEMIARRLPFDEPKTEEGQQDGLLRIHFRAAYKKYRRSYEFNGDKYYVFDGYGRPRLPQVCIDFITDAFDWGTGGHWPNRGDKRRRIKGALNFGSMGIENSRSIESLAAYATEVPEWFDMLWLPKKEQVKFRNRGKFFEALKQNASRYRRGDVVFIYGLRDDGKFHYHSFLIDEKDPLTGIPTVVLANAGPPQARSWEGEMQNAPQRAIVVRMRVRREILALAREQAKKHPGEPLIPPEIIPEVEEEVEEVGVSGPG